MISFYDTKFEFIGAAFTKAKRCSNVFTGHATEPFSMKEIQKKRANVNYFLVSLTCVYCRHQHGERSQEQ